MSSKITIIGAGSVGSTIAYTLASEAIASEIVMIDINKEKVEGEVMDILQGTCFRSPISMIAGEYEDARDSDIVIITSGIARKPEKQVIGSGTLLDTARLRCGISEHFKVAQANIHAYVFGEHGDTSFIPWTGAYISGVSVDEYYENMKALGKEIQPIDKEAMLNYVQKSGGQIIAKKGATFYAVSVTVCKLVNLVLAASDTITTVSSMMHGEYGIEDVCLSTLTLVGPNGIQGKVPMRMNKNEIEQLRKSADALKNVIAQINL